MRRDVYADSMFFESVCSLKAVKGQAFFAGAALIKFLNNLLFVRFIAGLKIICKGKVE